jgi:hypothetical protein
LFFGAIAYFLLQGFARSPSATFFWGSFLAIGLLEGSFEIGGIRLGMFAYYGHQPVTIGGFPLHLAFVNSTLALGFACLAQAWFRRVRGSTRYLLMPLTVPALVGLYGAMVMPVAAGLHSQDRHAALAGSTLTILIAVSLAFLAFKCLRLTLPARS